MVNFHFDIRGCGCSFGFPKFTYNVFSNIFSSNIFDFLIFCIIQWILLCIHFQILNNLSFIRPILFNLRLKCEESNRILIELKLRTIPLVILLCVNFKNINNFSFIHLILLHLSLKCVETNSKMFYHNIVLSNYQQYRNIVKIQLKLSTIHLVAKNITKPTVRFS